METFENLSLDDEIYSKLLEAEEDDGSTLFL